MADIDSADETPEQIRDRLLQSLGHPPASGELDHEELAGLEGERIPPLLKSERSITDDIRDEARWQVPAAAKSVGGAIGEVAGTAVGSSIVTLAIRHAPVAIAGVVIAVGTIGTIYGWKVVTKAFGTIAGGVVAGNIITGAGLIVSALYQLNRDRK